jgi:hypothetical protein
MIAALFNNVSYGVSKPSKRNTYGTIPRVATADGKDRIPTDTFSAIMTEMDVRSRSFYVRISNLATHAFHSACLSMISHVHDWIHNLYAENNNL